MSAEADAYASYLLCLWLGNESGKPVWRSSLESTRNPERHNFHSLDELVNFLQRRFGDHQGSHEEGKGELPGSLHENGTGGASKGE